MLQDETFPILGSSKPAMPSFLLFSLSNSFMLTHTYSSIQCPLSKFSPHFAEGFVPPSYFHPLQIFLYFCKPWGSPKHAEVFLLFLSGPILPTILSAVTSWICFCWEWYLKLYSDVRKASFFWQYLQHSEQWEWCSRTQTATLRQYEGQYTMAVIQKSSVWSSCLTWRTPFYRFTK